MAVLTILVAVPTLTGRPIVSYAASGSMEPTIGTFDLYLANPLPGRVQQGDVIVFQSVTKGGPAVHRAVATDGVGWYTQGDANPNVDQLAGEPVVTHDRVLAKVVTWPDGSPIVLRKGAIPIVDARNKLEQTVQEMGGPANARTYALLGAAAIVGLLSLVVHEKRHPAKRRSRALTRWMRRAFPRGVRGRHVGLAIIAVLLVAGLAAARASRQELPSQIIVVENAAAADEFRAATPGGTLHREAQTGSLGFLPTIVIAEPGDANVRLGASPTVLRPLSTGTIAYDQAAGDAHGVQTDSLVVYRYPAFLPAGAMVALHDVNPYAPDLVLAAALIGGTWLWMRAARIDREPAARLLGLQEDWA